MIFSNSSTFLTIYCNGIDEQILISAQSGTSHMRDITSALVTTCHIIYPTWFSFFL